LGQSQNSLKMLNCRHC